MRSLANFNRGDRAVPRQSTVLFYFVMLAVALLLQGISSVVCAQEEVHFPTLAHTPGESGIALDGYLYRPNSPVNAPALVFQHGCGGLINKYGHLNIREVTWAEQMTALGYVVLIVDSFRPRGIKQMCAPRDFQADAYVARPLDALGALVYLRTLGYVDITRVGLVGWSEGGGSVLMTMNRRPDTLPVELEGANFRTAVAFYPASCSSRRMQSGFATSAPLLILVGDKDVWTPAAPCQAIMDGVAGVEMKIYPGAFHDFDWPDMPVHEVPAFRTNAGVVPIEGMNPDARADALVRVPAFLARSLTPGHPPSQ